MKYLVKDKTGRGYVVTLTARQLKCRFKDETDYYGQSLHEWIKDAEPGDVFANAAICITCLQKCCQ